jgi:hypothetical protein
MEFVGKQSVGDSKGPSIVKHPEAEDLRSLPLRAIVAYAVRWAQRVRPAFAASGDGASNEDQHALDSAIAAAKCFIEAGESVAGPREAMALAMAAANAAASGEDAGSRYAARSAALAAETLAHALGAFGRPSPPQADDILEMDDPLTLAVEAAATAAHTTAYSARFALKELGITTPIVDDFAILRERFDEEDDRIGTPMDFAELGSLWNGAEPDWRS